ncbi:MAG: rhomboid family intramembrane serine protease [Alicyclobacillus sp.]|nr:rhomboid family intramembrane serine protease [Alicyclobacillus sp.]
MLIIRSFYPTRRRPTRFGRIQARATWTLIIVNVLWFVVVEQLNGLSIQGLMASGALAGEWLAVGQWYRALASMFVHASLTHLGFNMISLWSLSVVEYMLGWAPFLITYTLSGLAAGLLSAWLSPDVAMVGASGAIFGVFGAALALAFRDVFPKASRNQMLLVLVVNFVYDFATPHIGVLAHVIGLLVGGLLTYTVPAWGRYHIVVRCVAIGCAIAMVASLLAVL